VAVPLISGITAGKCGNSIFKLSGSPRIDSYLAWRSSAGILEQSMGTRNRVGKESIPGLLKSIKIPYQYVIPIPTRFIALINVLKFQHRSLNL
jgi:hypothetical protein